MITYLRVTVFNFFKDSSQSFMRLTWFFHNMLKEEQGASNTWRGRRREGNPNCLKAVTWKKIIKNVANQPKRVRVRKRDERTYRWRFTFTTRFCPFRPEYTSNTRPRGQIPRGVMSFRIQTKSLTLSGDCLFSFHLDLFSGVSRYSLTSRFQKWFIICWRFLYDLKLTAIWLPNFPGGRELNGRLIRKWLGVRGISLSGRSATFVRGREFKMGLYHYCLEYVNWESFWA